MAPGTMALSSDGNLVYFGNADANGANVNRNTPDDSNSNLRAVASRRNGDHRGRPAVFVSSDSVVFLSQPPIILPISTPYPDNSAYPASLRHRVSCASRR